MKRKTKRLFYCEDEGNFYWVKESPKQIKIEWVAKYNCDSEKTQLDQNVRWKELVVSTCGKNRKHCLKEFEDNYILIYPNQSGIPFALELATQKNIQKEIDDCKKWGVSDEFYQDLIPFLNDK
jgi:hypothetical protein